MNILLADDEKLALKSLSKSVEEVFPNANVVEFLKPTPLLEYVSENNVDIAFLDINMRGKTGIEIAKIIQEKNPLVNIVFVTGFDEYKGDAMDIHASGYIMKPVTPEKVRSELKYMRNLDMTEKAALIKVKCFGHFEAFDSKDNIIKFKRSKSKEVFAYLIYLKGSACTAREIAAILFEESKYDVKEQQYTQKIIYSMMKDLTAAGLQDIIVKSYNNIAVDIKKIDCDYYKLLKDDLSVLNSYAGEFMSQYYWAEDVVGFIDRMVYDE